MKFNSFRSLAALGLSLLAAVAAATDISQTPLIVASPDSVKANIFFILDDSGSMSFDFLPDHINGDGSPDPALCRSGGATGVNSGSFNATCCQGGNNNSACWTGSAPFGSTRGHPPFLAAGFNGLAYNPATLYLPPIKSDGSYWPSQTSAATTAWTAVKNDAYGVQNSGSINLTTQYPDTEWCTDSNYTDCLRNDNYVLPGTVAGKNYTTFHATTATGSGKVATGAPDNASVVARDWGPHYYQIVPAEYCDKIDLRNCQASQSVSFPYPAPVRWCNSDANARATTPAAGSCQAIRNGTFSNARYPTKFFTAGTAVPAVPETLATATFSISGIGGGGGCTVSLTAVTVNGTNLLAASTGSTNSAATMAGWIITQINAKSAVTKYTAAQGANTKTVVITAPSGMSTPSTVSFTKTPAGCGFSTSPASPTFSGYVAPKAAIPGTASVYPGQFQRIDIVPSVLSYPKASTRTDCAGATCTYDEEMTNFANWWTYYHTRMQSMKSSAALAFNGVGNNRRVGYMSINNQTGSDFLNLDTFDGTQRDNWYTKLTHAKPGNSTPLRAALSTAGRMFGGKLNGSTLNGSTVKDPMQYSCQKNFTILSTDGFWNESTNPKQLDGSTDIGDQDSKLARPMLDGTATGNTLADVAAYYYNTDLRTTALNNCASGSGSGADVCGNDSDIYVKQMMYTFTLGLGASGYMQFSPDYLSLASGDYQAVATGATANPAGGICSWQASGACNWPIPVSNTLTAVDDLWHAAVNGGGTYFSATNPTEIKSGLSNALQSLAGKVGAAAAATTSNPNVTASDNSIFVSNFKSAEWYGELKAQTIDINTGAVNAAVTWSARELLDANTSRTIYGFSSGAANKLRAFTWDNLSATEQTYFSISAAQPLTQFCVGSSFCLSAADQVTASGKKVFEFVLGDRTNEGDIDHPDKYFRKRTSLLGDIVSSEAVYVAAPGMNYVDAGYAAYKASAATRPGMVYVGANDGMLHAFRAMDGVELWAYVPSAVIANLYKLADKQYATKHQYYVDATPATADVFINGEWRTVLVGGLGAGGRAYYALDITDPSAPKALWELTDANLGLTFGRPEIGKLKDGTWVAFLPSGYNNTNPGDGGGHLYVRKLSDGSSIRTIDTGVGDTGTPSGLAQISAWVDKGDLDSTVLRVYGGDNLGNLWRFDVNGDIGAPGYDAQHLATLKSKDGTLQPVTSRPELGQVGGAAMVYVGTGRYLGTSDLTDASSQSIYAVRDRLDDKDWGNARDAANNFVQQTLTVGNCPANSSACNSGAVARTNTSPNPVDLTKNGGWFVDLPATRERVTTDPQLALGTLVVNSNVINVGDVCTVGGSAWENFLDYRTGAPVSTANGVASVSLGGAIATRPSIVRLPNGKVIAITRMSNDATVTANTPLDTPVNPTRVLSWRDLIQQ